MPETLAQKVRAKFPGAYDDLSDQQLESSVRAKFPGVYDDLPSTPAAHEPSMLERMSAIADSNPITAGAKAALSAVPDLVIGAGKRLAESGLRGGALLRQIPGVQALDNAIGNPGVTVNTAPSNLTQRVGGVAEQIAEVAAPSRAITGLGTKTAEVAAPTLARFVGSRAATLAPRVAVEAAGGGALTAMQGGDATTGAAISGAIPLVGSAVRAAVPALKASAETSVTKALGATKEYYKALGAKLAPEMLKRGIRGSREALAEQAGAAAEVAGQAIDDALKAYGSREVGLAPVVAAIEQAKGAFQTVNAAGKTIVFEPRAVKQLDGLQKIVTQLGPDARVDQLVALRRTWDKVVADAGGFAHRAPGGIGRPLQDISEAASKREATTAIRQLLNQEVPELTALNKEYSFWKNLDDVVTQTLQRKQPQAASLTGAIKETGGQVVGAAVSGGSVGAAVGLGKLAKLANAVFTSPRWQLASAQAKDALADAIVSGNPSRIAGQLSRIGAVESAKLVPSR